MKKLIPALAIAASLVVVGARIAPISAEEMGGMHGEDMHEMMGHGAMGDGMAQPKGDDGPASLAYQGANAKMHAAMAISYSGDADADFVRGMIPHHQGAIDMAKIVLAFGTDPEIKRLAEEIIKAQESEIALMQEWLKKKGQ